MSLFVWHTFVRRSFDVGASAMRSFVSVFLSAGLHRVTAGLNLFEVL